MPTRFSRYLTRKGYGVQSPFAYHFLRDVIVEKGAYYAYEDLRIRFGKRREEDFLRLLLRIANAVQPTRCIVSPDLNDECLHAYIQAGCRKCQIVSTEANKAFEKIDLLLVSSPIEVETYLPRLAKNGCVVVKNIRQDRPAWKQLIQDHTRHIVVYDCHQYGIILFHPSHHHSIYYI